MKTAGQGEVLLLEVSSKCQPSPWHHKRVFAEGIDNKLEEIIFRMRHFTLWRAWNRGGGLGSDTRKALPHRYDITPRTGTRA